MKTAILADLLDFTGDPGLADRYSSHVRWRPAHWLLIDETGRPTVDPAVVAAAPTASAASAAASRALPLPSAWMWWCMTPMWR